MEKFEKGVGIVLCNAWHHVEAIQTTDLPLFVEHCSQVLEFALGNYNFVKEMVNDGSLCKRQEVVAIHFLYVLMKRIDDIGEDRVMPMIKVRRRFGGQRDGTNGKSYNHSRPFNSVQEKKLFSLILQFLHEWSTSMTEDSLILTIKAMAIIISTEDFATFKDAYIAESDRDILVELKDEEWLEDICDDESVRRAIRPFLDLCKESSRRKRK